MNSDHKPTAPQHCCLNVPITVKECAGVGAKGWPTTAIVPLPKGQFLDVTTFILTDSSGRSVPAHFRSVNRHCATDNSIRHLQVHFLADVPPFSGAGTGTAVYWLKNEGKHTPLPRFPAWVGDGPEAVVVKNNLGVKIYKKPFRIETPLGDLEALFTDQDGTTVRNLFQVDDVNIRIEESGPIRAVVRADSPTFRDENSFRPGWAIRLYFYANQPFIKIDFQLQNSAKTVVKSGPLYFEALRLEIKTQQPSIPTELRAERLTEPWINKPLGVLNAGPLSVMIRNFYETWPNGLAVTEDGSVSAQLFPEWSAQFWHSEVSQTGLYWLDDMQHVVKETLWYFGAIEPAKLQSLARTFQYRPVATLPVSWYSDTAVTLDLGGVVPLRNRATSLDLRVPTYGPKQMDPASELGYQFGWANFKLDVYRKKDPSMPGNWPYSVSNFIATENPADYFHAEDFAMGELNGRPQWMARFKYALDGERLGLSPNPYGGSSWRKFYGGDTPKTLPYLPGTGYHARPRDDQHGWFYHMEEAYYYTGNLWIKDWYEFIGEFRKGRLNQKDPFPDMSSRAVGHALNHALQAYRVTGQKEILTMVKDYILKYIKPKINQYGLPSMNEATFQLGYHGRTLIDYLAEAGDDPEVIDIIKGVIEWNISTGNFSYYWDARTKSTSKGVSSGSGVTLGDVQAWYAIRFKSPAAFDQLKQFVETGIRGDKAYGNLKNWSGDFVGRLTAYLFQHPELVRGDQ